MSASTENGKYAALVPQPPRSRGRWFAGLAAIILLTEQTALGFSLIAPTIGGFAGKYQTTQIIWMITIFTLVGGVSNPLVGKLADQFGKRRVLIVAAVIASLGAVISAVSTSFGVLLAGRALMGLSMVFAPVTFALIRDVFPKNYRAMSIAIASNGVGVIAILGPFMAGFLIDHYALESVFWVVAVMTLVGSAGVIALVPETTVFNKSRIDYVGAGLFTGGFLLIMLGISQLPTWTFSDARTYLTLGGGLVILAVWWAWERRVDEPFIDPQLLTTGPIAPVLMAYTFAAAATVTVGSFLPMMLMTPRGLGGDYGFGLSATGVAGYSVLGGTVTVLGGVLVGALAKRFGLRAFLLLAPLVATFGALGLAFLRTEPWMPIVSNGLFAFGYVSIAAGVMMLMSVAPPHQRGITAAMTSALGGALGSLAAQIASMMLNKNVATVVEGQPFYTARGLTYVFLIAAGLSVISFVFALFAPGKAAEHAAAVQDGPPAEELVGAAR